MSGMTGLTADPPYRLAALSLLQEIGPISCCSNGQKAKISVGLVPRQGTTAGQTWCSVLFILDAQDHRCLPMSRFLSQRLGPLTRYLSVDIADISSLPVPASRFLFSFDDAHPHLAN